MTGDQRTIQQWTVRIDGIDQKTVKPGDSIEIGRKPLRPLPDDGTERLEIADGTRSMSKRHATFAVSQNGGGTVRDLGSTNGSYVVRGNGDLMRLPPNVDFLLPTSPMRLQFGDVPVDFIRVEQPVSDTFVVPDLFGYALETVKQEPDVADMSVDDILDLRAGEPTAAISAATVRKRVGELNAAASQTFPPQKTTTADGLAADSAAGAAEPDSELAVSSDAAMPVDAADAAVSTETATSDTASPETVTSGAVASESAADTVPADSAVSDSVVTAAQSQTNDEPSEPDSMPLNVAGAKPAVALPRDLFADALAEDSEEAGQSTAPAEQADQLANGQPSDDRFQQASSDQEVHDDIRQAVNEVAANAAGVEVTAGAVAGATASWKPIRTPPTGRFRKSTAGSRSRTTTRRTRPVRSDPHSSRDRCSNSCRKAGLPPPNRKSKSTGTPLTRRRPRKTTPSSSPSRIAKSCCRSLP